jgi:hypothetical protein
MKKISYTKNQETPAYLFVMLWLSTLAGLLAWKGSTYSETVLIRKYLGMTEPSTSHTWWTGAAGIVAVVSVWLGYLLFRKVRAGIGSDSMTYAPKKLLGSLPYT